jgi:hypothetical protein
VRAMSKDFAPLVAALIASGGECRVTDDGAFHLYAADGSWLTVFSNNPRHLARSRQRVKSKLRRIGVIA